MIAVPKTAGNYTKLLIMIKDKYINLETEINLLHKLGDKLIADGYHAGNTIIVTVSTDYSSIVGQYLRHALSHNREICDGFGVDVPYPDEIWNKDYIRNLHNALIAHEHLLINNKSLLLVEAGVIRGGNYKYVTNYIQGLYDNPIHTLTLYENIGSAFKSKYVGEFYNNDIEDLTFWWEKDNKHWKR